uniref:RRM domain-containing protein n=1 Tax=Sus scrofa TaxID=9823 RepID=A0A8D1ERV1_PIG
GCGNLLKILIPKVGSNRPKEMNEEMMYEKFSTAGPILSIRVCLDLVTRRSLGYAYVNFLLRKDTEWGMNGKILKGNQIYVGRAQNKAERQSELKHKFEQIRQGKLARCEGANLYVKNLEDDIDNRRLKREFSLFGTITSARVMMEAGSSKGFGFVCYTSPEEANKAIVAMNGKILIAKPLYVAIAQSKEECQAFLTKTCIERMVALKDGGYPILNTSKPVRTSSCNCVPTHSQPQRGSELPSEILTSRKFQTMKNISIGEN